MAEYITSELVMNYPQIMFLKEFLVGHPGFIAGGCFRAIFTGSKPTDVDMFFRDKSEYNGAVKYFSDRPEEYTRGYQNKNVESFIHVRTGIRIECVRKVFGSPKEILDNFDFTITKFAFYTEVEPPDDPDGSWSYTDFVTYHADFFEHMMMKRLVVDEKMLFPVSTLHRTYKYARYGFFPCRETKAKLIRGLRALPDFTDDDLAKSFYEGMD